MFVTNESSPNAKDGKISTKKYQVKSWDLN